MWKIPANATTTPASSSTASSTPPATKRPRLSAPQTASTASLLNRLDESFRVHLADFIDAPDRKALSEVSKNLRQSYGAMATRDWIIRMASGTQLPTARKNELRARVDLLPIKEQAIAKAALINQHTLINVRMQELRSAIKAFHQPETKYKTAFLEVLIDTLRHLKSRPHEQEQAFHLLFDAIRQQPASEQPRPLSELLKAVKLKKDLTALLAPVLDELLRTVPGSCGKLVGTFHRLHTPNRKHILLPSFSVVQAHLKQLPLADRIDCLTDLMHETRLPATLHSRERVGHGLLHDEIHCVLNAPADEYSQPDSLRRGRAALMLTILRARAKGCVLKLMGPVGTHLKQNITSYSDRERAEIIKTILSIYNEPHHYEVHQSRSIIDALEVDYPWIMKQIATLAPETRFGVLSGFLRYHIATDGLAAFLQDFGSQISSMRAVDRQTLCYLWDRKSKDRNESFETDPSLNGHDAVIRRNLAGLPPQDILTALTYLQKKSFLRQSWRLCQIHFNRLQDPLKKSLAASIAVAMRQRDSAVSDDAIYREVRKLLLEGQFAPAADNRAAADLLQPAVHITAPPSQSQPPLARQMPSMAYQPAPDFSGPAAPSSSALSQPVAVARSVFRYPHSATLMSSASYGRLAPAQHPVMAITAQSSWYQPAYGQAPSTARPSTMPLPATAIPTSSASGEAVMNTPLASGYPHGLPSMNAALYAPPQPSAYPVPSLTSSHDINSHQPPPDRFDSPDMPPLSPG